MIDQLLTRLRRAFTAPPRSKARPGLRIGSVEQLETRAMLAALSSFSETTAGKLDSLADADPPRVVVFTALRSSSEQAFSVQPIAAPPILQSSSQPAPEIRVRDGALSPAPATDLLPSAGLPAASLSVARQPSFYLKSVNVTDSTPLGQVLSVFPGASIAAVRPLPAWQDENLPWQRPILSLSPGNLHSIDIIDGVFGRIILGRPEPLPTPEGPGPDVDQPSTPSSNWTRPASASSLATDLVFATGLDWLSINPAADGHSDVRRLRASARLALPFAGGAPADSSQYPMDARDASHLQSLEDPMTDDADDSLDPLASDDHDDLSAKDSRQTTSPISHQDQRDDRSRSAGAATNPVEAAPGFGIHRLTFESLLSVIALDAEAIAAACNFEQLGFIEIANTGWIEPGPQADAAFPSSATSFGIVEAPLQSIMDCNFTVEYSSDAAPHAATEQLQVAEFKVEKPFE